MVQLRDHAGVVLAERSAPVGQDAQHGELLVVDDRAQAGHPGANQGDRVRVGGVGLAALPGGEDADPGGQLRGHVDDLLPVGEKSGSDVPADAAAALDSPDALWPTLRVAEHRGVARAVGGVAAAVEDRLVRRHHLDRDGSLVWIHADDHTGHECLPARARWMSSREGSATSS